MPNYFPRSPSRRSPLHSPVCAQTRGRKMIFGNPATPEPSASRSLGPDQTGGRRMIFGYLHHAENLGIPRSGPRPGMQNDFRPPVWGQTRGCRMIFGNPRHAGTLCIWHPPVWAQTRGCRKMFGNPVLRGPRPGDAE